MTGLKEGRYTVNVTYLGNDHYYGAFASANFTVAAVRLNITGTGNETIVNVTITDNSNGTLVMTINGTDYPAQIVNGTGTVELGNLTPGVHDAVITYTDTDGVTSVINATVEVPKWDTAVDMEVIEAINGTTIVVTSEPATDGLVLVNVDGVGYYVNMTNGTAKFILSDLAVGNHTATVAFMGNDLYNNVTVTKEFTTDEAIVLNVTGTGSETLVNVTVPGNNTNGTVIIRINGTDYNATVINGTAVVNLTDVAPGTYNATIIYIDGNNKTSELNTTITVPKWTADVDVTVAEAVEGVGTTIVVTIDPATDGIVLVNVDGEGYYVNMTNGSATITIKDLAAGNHTAVVTFQGNDKYNEVTKTVDFTVDEGFKLEVNGTGNGTVIEVKVPGNATNGTVTIVINGTNYTADVINGTAVINLTNVTPGIHNATVIYVGGNNKTSEINTTIAVPKWKAQVNATGVDIIEGFDEVISIKLSTKDATGLVLVEVDGVGYYVNVTDGVINLTVPGLKSGKYTADVTYLGNNYYDVSTAKASFNVGKAIETSVNGTGNSSVIRINLGNDTNGTVTIIIDGKNYTGNVTNGTAVIDLSDVTPGVHNATIIFVDGNNRTSVMNTTITIPKWDAKVNATAVDIRQGDTETITIHVSPVNATGVVLVDIAGKGYYVNLTDGKAVLEVENLKAGTYDVTVTYMGDKYYNNATNVTSFRVSNAIQISTNGTGNNTDIVIELPENTTGNVTVIIDGKVYNVTTDANGTVVIPLNNVTPGEHNITVIYVDANGTESVVNDTFTVTLYDTPITIDVSDIYVTDTLVVTVTVPDAIEGEVTIEIDGVIHTKKPQNGKAVFEITDLLAGNKTVTASYAGDSIYGFNATTAEFNVFKRDAPISVTVDSLAAGKANITVTLPANATGYVIVKVANMEYGINLTNTNSVVVPIKSTGDYTADVTYLGDYQYLGNATAKGFSAKGPSQSGVSVEVEDTPVGQDMVVKVTVPDDATGNVTVMVDGKPVTVTNVTGGDNYIKVPGVKEGTHEVEVIYSGDSQHDPVKVTKEVTVFKSVIAESSMTRGWNSPYDFKAEFLDSQGHVLADTVVKFTVNGKTYNVKTDKQGIAYLTASKLGVGSYDVTVYNPITGETVKSKVNIVKRLINNKDITMDFVDGTYYKVTAIGDDGKPVGKGEVVGIHVNGRDYVAITDANGLAKLKINLNPKTYTITAQYANYKVSNKLVVKQTLKLVKKTITIKKSASSIKLKATLKWTNGKAIKGKKIVFKFKGKQYTAKTNSKGIAQVTIKKSVINKLKKGKSYKFSAKYITNYVYGNVKVSK